MGVLLGQLNWVDLLVVILLIRAGYIGANTGLSVEIFKLLGIFAALFLSLSYYSHLGTFLNNYILLPESFAKVTAFLILVIVPVFIFKVVRTFVQLFATVEFIPGLDKFGGIVLGITRGVILASLILYLMMLLPSNYLKESVTDRSLVGSYFVKIAPGVHRLSSIWVSGFKSCKQPLTKYPSC